MSNKKKQLVILTGMSGSGKSMAVNTFEDLDFFCIDNLPPNLIPETVDLWAAPRETENLASGADVRSGQFFDELLDVCQSLRQNQPQHFARPVVLFLDAADAEHAEFSAQANASRLAELEDEYQRLKSRLLRGGTAGEIPVRRVVAQLDLCSDMRRLAEQAEKGARYLDGLRVLTASSPARAA